MEFFLHSRSIDLCIYLPCHLLLDSLSPWYRVLHFILSLNETYLDKVAASIYPKLILIIYLQYDLLLISISRAYLVDFVKCHGGLS
jgi:hypothetical protein